jgi:hypothetical protein
MYFLPEADLAGANLPRVKLLSEITVQLLSLLDVDHSPKVLAMQEQMRRMKMQLTQYEAMMRERADRQ